MLIIVMRRSKVALVVEIEDVQHPTQSLATPIREPIENLKKFK